MLKCVFFLFDFESSLSYILGFCSGKAQAPITSTGVYFVYLISLIVVNGENILLLANDITVSNVFEDI